MSDKLTIYSVKDSSDNVQAGFDTRKECIEYAKRAGLSAYKTVTTETLLYEPKAKG